MKKHFKSIVSATITLSLGLSLFGAVTVAAASQTTNPQKALFILNDRHSKFIYYKESKGKRERIEENNRHKSIREKYHKEHNRSKTEPLHQYGVKALNSKDVDKLLVYASKFQGIPYHFGGTTPRGFDCSGYVCYIFKNALGLTLPRSADAQYHVGKRISKGNLKPGDLVFFTTYARGVSHSGVYVGDNKFISATSSRGVQIADMSTGYWKERYIGAKRILK